MNNFDRSLKTFLWISLAGLIPAIINISIHIIKGNSYPWYHYHYIIGIISSVIITNVVSYTVMITLSWLERRFTWERSPVLRIIIELFSTNIIVALMMIGCGLLSHKFAHGTMNHTLSETIFMFVLIGAIMNFIITVIYESSYFFRRWKESMLKAERLEREIIQSQFDILKQQINPHFLFNSLNVLSSLVHSDANKSEEFIDEFAKVYRYILDKSGKPVVTIQDELEIVNSYLFLQKIRFNEGLEITINFSESELQNYIPTLGLQLLLENAVKHNTISAENPLRIEIFVQNEMIIVKNNLQLRNERIKSTGKGLNNLRERYRLIAGKLPMFLTIDDFFVAKIPLLKYDTINKYLAYEGFNN